MEISKTFEFGQRLKPNFYWTDCLRAKLVQVDQERFITHMIIEKLTWATSKSKDPINAVDIHRDGSRFVTCQGNRIYIWRMQGLELPENEEKHIVKSTDDTEISVSTHVFNAVHQFVCELRVHQKPVNCVRFSPNGLYLAASSDDGVVSLYKLEKSSTQLDVNKTEDWRCIKLFKEHIQDVLGVEWSPDSKLLASCSVDNKIIIYDIEKKEKLKEMIGEGFVKGLAWDPLGKYLASQGDKDFTVWSTTTWEKHFVNTTFFELSHSVLFVRPTWMPDGSTAVASNAVRGGKFIVPLMNRLNEFKSQFDYSGHKGSITVTKANPVIFREKKKEIFYGVLALGGEDSMISIWSTIESKPLYVIKQAFSGPIYDLSWSEDGRILLVSSEDGSLACIRFEKEELGEPVPREEVLENLKKVYGEIGMQTFKLMEYPLNTAMEKLPITSKLAQFLQTQKVDQPAPEQTTTPSSTVHILQPKRKVTPTVQRETITKEGKRRITPIAVDAMEVEEPVQTQDVITSSPQHDMAERIRKRLREEVVSTPIKRAKTKEISENLFIKINDEQQIRCSKEGEISFMVGQTAKWKANIGETTLLAVANNNFVAVAGRLNSLHIFSINGRRLFTPIILDNAAEFLSCNKDTYLICVTIDLMMHLWDVQNRKNIIQCSVDPLINRFIRSQPDERIDIHDVGVTDSGKPIITLSNGESYTFNNDMKSWILVAGLHSPASPFVTSGNIYSIQEKNKFSLRNLRAIAARLSEKNRLNTIENTTVLSRSSQTVEDLENGMLAAAELDDPEGYIHYVTALAKHLSSLNDENKLRELCSFLLGPIHNPDSKWDSTIATLPKREVLQEVLSILSTNMALQRLVNEFRVALNNI